MWIGDQPLVGHPQSLIRWRHKHCEIDLNFIHSQEIIIHVQHVANVKGVRVEQKHGILKDGADVGSKYEGETQNDSWDESPDVAERQGKLQNDEMYVRNEKTGCRSCLRWIILPLLPFFLGEENKKTDPLHYLKNYHYS